MIAPEELEQWVVSNDERFLVVNKPGMVVCHPSKRGPWSSLVGAAREYLGVERLHMPFRLDRETSGVVVFVKHQDLASQLQRAVMQRRFSKAYLAVLEGTLPSAATVNQPIGRAENARVWLRQAVRADGAASETFFEPMRHGGGRTLVRVVPTTGRLHQIRVHAAWLGHPVTGDKLYGPDEGLFLEFIRDGFTERLARALPLPRLALHALEVRFDAGDEYVFRAPMAGDLADFCRQCGLLEA
jgi:23S rRNA pseudouridine1911/1915/1917 synthase